MWIESRDGINKIFKDQKTDFYLDGLSLYKNNSLISDGFILVNSVNLHFYDHSKEAIFHCIYFQENIEPLKLLHIQIKWFAFDEETSLYDIDFSEMIDQTNPAKKLKANKDVRIYEDKPFNKAVKTILKQVIKWRRDELLQHIGWGLKFHSKRKPDYSFWGILDEFTLTKQGKFIGEYSILPENNQKPFSFSEMETLFDQIDPAVCYPLFLAVVYSIIDPEIFGVKYPLYINICGKYKRDKKRGIFLSPQFIANLLCNFNFDTDKNRQLHGIKRSAHNISINDDSQTIRDKIILNQNFPVIVFGGKREISGSSKAYRQINKDMAKIHGRTNSKFTPFFITEKPIQRDEIICLKINNTKKSGSIDTKETICRLHNFYEKLISDLCDFFTHHYITRDGFTRDHQIEMNKLKKAQMANLQPSVLFDENRSYELDAFASAMAVLFAINEYNNEYNHIDLSDEERENANNEFLSFANKTLRWTCPLLQLPWIDDTPQPDTPSLFLEYVHNALKNNFEDIPYFTDITEDMVFLAYPDCIKHFCEAKGFADSRNEICRFLKKHGYLKTNKNGYFVSRQVAKVKHNVLAMKADLLENISI